MPTAQKKVLQLCHGYGAPFADVARQWRAKLDSEHYQVVTVFLVGEENASVSALVGGEVIFLNYDSRDLKGLKLKQKQAVRRLHADYGFDLVIAHRYKPMHIASVIPDIPILGVSHAYGVFNQFFRRRWALRHQKHLQLIGVSDAITADIRRHLKTFPADKLKTLYNHIDTRKHRQHLLDRAQARDALGVPQESTIIANVGRLHPDKDQATLIGGFAQWRQQGGTGILVIIGSGRLEAELKALAAALGVQEAVLFLGQIPEAWKYFKAFDVFALSSDHEPFGMVLLEAMIAGVPVLASDVGGAPEVVGDTGILFPVGDAQALAQALERILDARPTAEHLINRVETHFSDEALRAQLMQLLNELPHSAP